MLLQSHKNRTATALKWVVAVAYEGGEKGTFRFRR